MLGMVVFKEKTPDVFVTPAIVNAFWTYIVQPLAPITPRSIAGSSRETFTARSVGAVLDAGSCAIAVEIW